jgi:DNA-binding SARP family transcriptional activator
MLDNEAAQSTLERALAIGQADNLPGVIFLASYFAGLVAVRLDRQDTAIQCLRRMEAMADPASRIQRAILHAYRGWLAVEREQPAEALREGEVAWDLGAELGSPSYLVHWGTPMVYGLVEAGRYGEARERLTLQREAMGGTRIRCFDPMLIAIEATLALREGDVDVARTLAVRAFRVAREQDHGGYLRRIKPWLGALAWLALEADAEVDYVQRFIGQARLEPPSQTARRWPWRCRVSALGRFEVLVDGRPLEHGRKVPKKPLALLRALIAAAKAAASDDALCEALWPDLDGDAAHQALTSAIHRLRVLLGSPGAVLVAGQRVCLNAREVWVDAWAFESLADAAGARDAMRAADALALYGGAFLPQEADSAWVLSMRERLRAKFIRLAAQLADAEEAAGRLEDAAAHYRRGLEVDDLAEPFCLGLMRCCKALDRPGEGIVAYRNLRQLLSVTLGRQPARDTEALYRDLLARG